MKNFATFTILGRIARITPLNNVTKVTIAANYRRKNKDGVWEDDPHFNEVTIFDASTRRQRREASPGRFARARSRPRRHSIIALPSHLHQPVASTGAR
jgi:single-strand DNA-binding protein